MNAPPSTKPLRPDQALAVDPFIHASLSASAGTGKTQVLTARVLRLLLAGAKPETILCLTFTKAAAAEMAERVNKRLAAWVRLDDPALDAELAAIGIQPDKSLRAAARRLFAAVLDCPGGLRIQTIHSFCQTLLAAFPAEAGVVPGSRAIEGREEDALIERTLASLAEESAAGDGSFLADLSLLAGRLGEEDVRAYLKACGSAGEGLSLFAEPELTETILRRHVLALPDGDIAEAVASLCADDSFDCTLLRGVSDAFGSWKTDTGQRKRRIIEDWLARDPAERCRTLGEFAYEILFTKAGDRRKVDKGVLKLVPEAEGQCDALAETIGRLLAMQRADQFAPVMAAGVRAGARFAAAYDRAKRAAGVAVFEDLIRWSRKLLEEPGIADWIRFKLDRRTDHLLVDEAQDTNEPQWAIVKALAEEFWAGEGAGPDHRTLFMVGDYKQAIYGFQGTDPREFDAARRYFRDRSEGSAYDFKELSISASFRSSQVVLDVVDEVLGGLDHDALGLSGPAPRHEAFHASRGGRVELLAPHSLELVDDGDQGEEGWEKEELRDYAKSLAERIKALIEEAPVLASTGRPLTAGDILVLVRSRASGLAGLLVSRLFEQQVPIAGLDRLILSKPLAVQDLLAAVGFAVQPEDDLTLANLLVSPLFGWTQDQLYDLARRSEKIGLWEELGRRRTEKPLFADTRAALEELLRGADFTGPYAFLERLLSGPLEGRRKLLGRLGPAARDPINELLSAALAFEGQETSGLQRFLHWFSSGEVEVKRDPEAQGDAVRIMTVHGAKGLEAPVVILADATADPAGGGRRSSWVSLPLPKGPVPMLRPNAGEVCPPFDKLAEEEKKRNLEEHFRLGYVALTRAAERLIVGGLRPRTKTGQVPAQSWHALVGDALAKLGAQTLEDGRVVLDRGTLVALAGPEPAAETGILALPEWAQRAAPAEARPPRPLSPSQIAPDDESRPPPSPELAAAAERGRLLHALFERLPATSPDARRQAAFAWLQHGAGVADGDLRTKLVDAALTVIEAPEHVELFSPEALAEAPIAATLPDGRVIAGTVDRLLVTPTHVRVVDFKTGRAVPRSLADVPASHRRQMNAYGAALGVIFPGRKIETALLYTAGPILIAVPLEPLPEPTHMRDNSNQEPSPS